jgi:hypothetical protein
MPLITPKELNVLSDSLRTVKKKNLAKTEQDNVYVELGVRRAETSTEIAKLLKSKPYSGDSFVFLGVDCDIRAQNYWIVKIRDHYIRGVKPKFFLGTTNEAIKYFGSVVWVFVDACHCFECATWDIENWGNKIIKGGHLVIHDTSVSRERYEALFQHNHTRRFGVSQAVRQSEYLKVGWEKIAEVENGNGIMVFEKTQ